MKALKILLIIFLFSFSTLKIQAAEPFRVLLVPGHDNESVGAQYGNVKEAAMNLAVARRIHAILKKDKRFQVFITRDTRGYTKAFENYFEDREEIIDFREKAKQETRE